MIPIYTAIISSITAILLIIIKWYLDNKTIKAKEKKEKEDKLITKQDVKKAERITCYLDILKDNIMADRVIVGLFHNGQYTLHNVSLKKYSFFYEVTKTNVVKIKEFNKNIDVTDYPCFMEKMVNEQVIVVDMEAIENDINAYELLKKCSNEYYFFKKIDVRFAIYLPIKDYLSESVIGFIGVHYEEDKWKELMNDCKYEYLTYDIHCNYCHSDRDKCLVNNIAETRNKVEKLLQKD